MNTKTTVSREKQLDEGVRRLRKLSVMPNVVTEFKEGKLSRSDYGGILYWLDDKEVKMVKAFEKENKAVVYHVIKSYSQFGELYSLLFVSQYEDEWEMDNNDLDENLTFAYVVNVDCPDCSEFGTIEIMPCIGGVARIS